MFLFTRVGRITMSSLIEKRIEGMKESKILFKGSPYAENTVNSWRNFSKVWNGFCREMNCDYRIRNWTDYDYNLFLQYCDCTDFSLTTKKLYSSMLKTVLKENGSRCVCTIGDFKPENHIYLSEVEIDAILKLDLSGNDYLSKIRDIFMVGYYTGQRFSDYKALSLNDVVTLEYSGRRFSAVRIRQTKTKTRITIPILDEKVLEILEKWGGRLPKVSHSGFNEGIKKICKSAGLTYNVVVSRSKGGKVVTETLPKWKMISSHTARRSCVTNLYLDGNLSEMQIRSISGHLSSESFRRYICCSEEENICNILKKLESVSD